MKLYYYSNELVWDMSKNYSQQRSNSQSYDKNAAQRARRWQQNNPERYREYRREYMRLYRQRKRLDNDNQTD